MEGSTEDPEEQLVRHAHSLVELGQRGCLYLVGSNRHFVGKLKIDKALDIVPRILGQGEG